MPGHHRCLTKVPRERSPSLRLLPSPEGKTQKRGAETSLLLGSHHSCLFCLHRLGLSPLGKPRPYSPDLALPEGKAESPGPGVRTLASGPALPPIRGRSRPSLSPGFSICQEGSPPQTITSVQAIPLDSEMTGVITASSASEESSVSPAAPSGVPHFLQQMHLPERIDH